VSSIRPYKPCRCGRRGYRSTESAICYKWPQCLRHPGGHLNSIARIIVLLSASLCPGLLFAADCSALKSLKLENTTITLAEPITSGTLTIIESRPSFTGLPPFCRVTGVLRPTTDSDIHFEIWLPAQNWNGRLLGAGNGGFAGSIGYDELATYLKRNFAVTGS